MRSFRALLFVGVSALLLSLPFHFGNLWFLAFIAFIPYWKAIENRSAGSVFKYSFLFGFLFYIFLGYWMMQVTVLGYVLLCGYLGLYFGIFGRLVKSFLHPDDDLLRQSVRRSIRVCFFLPAIWIVLEWVRSWMISGLPWSLLAYSQWKNIYFIQFSDITGAYGVSYFILFVNTVIYQILRSRGAGTKEFLSLLAGGIFLVGLYGVFSLSARDSFYKSPAPKAVLRVSVLQGNIPQEQKWDKKIKNIIFEKYKNLLFMSAIEKSDLIVWPETSFPGFLEDEVMMAAQLRAAIRQSRTDVLVGAPTLGNLEEGLKLFNSAVLFGPNGEESARYHKLHLVPFGEYVPFEEILGFIRNFATIGHFSAGNEYTLFTIRSRFHETPIQAKFAALICFEDIFPNMVRKFCNKGANFLVNITNDAWFGDTTAPYQHAQASVFRAIENRVPVVRAANTGLSCFISAEGRVLASVEDEGKEIAVTGHKSHEIILRKDKSFYTRFGDLFVYGCIFLCGLAFRYKFREDSYSKN